MRPPARRGIASNGTDVRHPHGPARDSHPADRAAPRSPPYSQAGRAAIAESGRPGDARATRRLHQTSNRRSLATAVPFQYLKRRPPRRPPPARPDRHTGAKWPDRRSADPAPRRHHRPDSADGGVAPELRCAAVRRPAPHASPRAPAAGMLHGSAVHRRRDTAAQGGPDRENRG